jgi:catechol 2,3-dioxygenase-like lactoylglutathione lyase family enzyme
MKTLGIRHVALNVQDPQVSKAFYVNVMRMKIEWEPDANNVYLTSDSQDNLALHKRIGDKPNTDQNLDHIGYILPSPESVDEWYLWIKSQNVKVVNEIKTHRDGARSFYISDPDGIVIQMIYHPPIAKR